ncbi:MAG: hypothetical protein K5660_08000 [Paludibacteraceae bacterium]|nr:hypothetical protein [Paludibacteraceae bacterium]
MRKVTGHILYCLAVALLLPSCGFKQVDYVDFADIAAAQGMTFRVIGQRETDLYEGLPHDTYLPDGHSVCDMTETEPAPSRTQRQTTSTTSAALIQNMLQYGNQNRVTEIAGTYPSTDVQGQPIVLSGKVMLPQGKRPKRMIVVSHYTIGSNAEAPSNCFPLEGVLVKLGYGLIIPDYIGYGVTVDKVHPYLVMNVTAHNVLDMYLAVRPWLKAVGMEPLENDIYLMGYSQGGATTMAVQYLIENEHYDDSTPDYVSIHRVFAGGGPYDVKATYERFVNSDMTEYPVAVPMVLQGMINGNNLNIRTTDIMQQWLYNRMDEWINSKRYTTTQINKLINTHITHELLTQEGMDQKSDNVAELYKAMTENSIVSYDWVPYAPVYMLHSMDDEVVSYTNATNAKSKWKEANITYNFGHYGGHIKTCLRFIYTVQQLLIQEEEERKSYE